MITPSPRPCCPAGTASWGAPVVPDRRSRLTPQFWSLSLVSQGHRAIRVLFGREVQTEPVRELFTGLSKTHINPNRQSRMLVPRGHEFSILVVLDADGRAEFYKAMRS
jgi:hypothetical protein